MAMYFNQLYPPDLDAPTDPDVQETHTTGASPVSVAVTAPSKGTLLTLMVIVAMWAFARFLAIRGVKASV